MLLCCGCGLASDDARSSSAFAWGIRLARLRCVCGALASSTDGFATQYRVTNVMTVVVMRVMGVVVMAVVMA